MKKGLTFVDFLVELGLGFLFLVCFVIIVLVLFGRGVRNRNFKVSRENKTRQIVYISYLD